MATEAAGFGLAYDTWVSAGGGLNTDRKGVYRYTSGPMKGMTRDQAMSMFRNKVWNNAAPEWKNEYARRATSGMYSPDEAAAAAKEKAARTMVLPPRPATTAAKNSATPSPTGSSTSGAGASPSPAAAARPAGMPIDAQTPAQRVADRVNPNPTQSPAFQNVGAAPNQAPAPAPASTTAPAGQTSVTPPQPKPTSLISGGFFPTGRASAAASSIAASAPSPAVVAQNPPTAAPQPMANTQEVSQYIQGQTQSGAKPSATPVEPPKMPAPSSNGGDMFTNEDMSGKGYTLVGGRSGTKRWRKNADMPAGAGSNATEMSGMTVSASREAPFSTKFDVTQGRVVATGGTPDEDFQRYDAAQTRLKAGQDTDEDKEVVKEYVGRDVLNRTPDQIAQDKAMESARGRGGSNWQEMDLARRKATQAQYQQQEDKISAAAKVKRDAEIEKRVKAEWDKPKEVAQASVRKPIFRR